MIIISREYIARPSSGGSYRDTEFKVFDDNDVKGVQDYLDTHHGSFIIVGDGMKIPDKIYIPLYPNYSLDGFHLADEWMYEPHKERYNVTYIRKNTLLSWAEEETIKAGKQSDSYGRRNAFMDVIDKINSM